VKAGGCCSVNYDPIIGLGYNKHHPNEWLYIGNHTQQSDTK